MNILVLYGFPDLALARNTSLNHLYCFRRYASEHDYFYYSGYHPVTKALRSIDFSAVILDTSFCSRRTWRPRSVFREFQDRWTWLADIPAVKIALPQDEYDHCAVLDDWFCELRVDTVYSVVGHRELLYPRSLKRAQFIDALTGYVDDAEVAAFRKYSGPLRDRRIDLGYRGRDLEPQYGRLGRLKAQIHHRFTAALANSDLTIDSAIARDAAIMGEDWFRFLSDCRFTPAGPSGVSMWDPRGEVREKTEAFRLERPDAGFEEIEAACFPGLDEKYRFTAISPRLFEATAAGACQILIEGVDYVGLQPDVHYIPLRADFSDLDTVVDRMHDLATAQQMADNCFEALIATDKFSYRRFVGEVLGRAQQLAAARGLPLGRDAGFAAKVQAHEREVAASREASRRAASGAGHRLGSVFRPGGFSKMLRAAPAALVRVLAYGVRLFTPRPVRQMLKRVLRPRALG